MRKTAEGIYVNDFMKKIFVLFIICTFSVIALAADADKVDTEKTIGENQFGNLPVEELFQPDCKAFYKEIEDDLEKANYCAEDSDCRSLELGGPLVEFGCYHFINKNANGEEIYKKMITYSQKCLSIVDYCAPSPVPKCVNRKCVYEGNLWFKDTTNK